eukprot:sb/3475653/
MLGHGLLCSSLGYYRQIEGSIASTQETHLAQPCLPSLPVNTFGLQQFQLVISQSGTSISYLIFILRVTFPINSSMYPSFRSCSRSGSVLSRPIIGFLPYLGNLFTDVPGLGVQLHLYIGQKGRG